MFIKNYIITGEIECLTGLHIGESLDTIDIGGSDNPLIRNSIDNLPYIPGSSLKGKLRSLLELSDKESSRDIIQNKGKVSKKGLGAKIFGIAANDEFTESTGLKFKTIVRDSFPTEDTKILWDQNPELLNGSELKYENNLNRINSSATPRNIERVPAGSKFSFEIIFNISNISEDYDAVTDENDYRKDLINLLNSMKLLEDDYLGGSGTRGFGKINFKNIKIIERPVDYYTDNQDEIIISEGTLEDIIKELK